MTPTDFNPASLLLALHAALAADPSDAATRLMLADLLEEGGNGVAARGQRWQAMHGKWPGPVANAPGKGLWRFWPGPTLDKSPEDLPLDVFRLLLPGDGRIGRYYPSRHAAEGDLASALERRAVFTAVAAPPPVG